MLPTACVLFVLRNPDDDQMLVIVKVFTGNATKRAVLQSMHLAVLLFSLSHAS
jgi:hypothetical protein